MTISASPSPHPTPLPAENTQAFSPQPHDWRVWTLLMAGLSLAYLLLQNPFWVPGGDSELYLDSARSLAQGRGYLWNGMPVAIAPPGWAWVMAGVMWISPYFLSLKLLAMLCMLGSLGISYWIVRRLLPLAAAALAVLLAGLLSQVYILGVWLHSDALFCLLTSAAILLAIQIREGRDWRWRIPVLLGVCAAAVLVRWAGLLNAGLVAAALLRGPLLPVGVAARGVPIKDYVFRVGLAAVCALVCVATLLIARAALAVSPDELLRYRVIPAAEDGSNPLLLDGQTLDAGSDLFATVAYDFITDTKGGRGGYGTRLLSWGRWVAFLLVEPLRLAGSVGPLWWVAMVFGWGVIGLLLLAAIRQMRLGGWLVPAAVLYSLLLALNWALPNSRYLVPVAPLIFAGVILGLAQLMNLASRAWLKTTIQYGGALMLAGVLLVNLALYVADVAVMRSPDFYDRWEAGLYHDVLASAKLLNAQGVEDGHVAVNPRYVNFGRPRYLPSGMRALVMLTGRQTVSVPRGVAGYHQNHPDLRRWIGPNGVRWCLRQNDSQRWRVRHFLLPGCIQRYLTTRPFDPAERDGWRLYRHVGAGSPLLMELPPLTPNDYPRRVPGL